MTAVVLCTLAAFLSFVVVPAAAFADDSIGISARPAGADGSPDGRSRFSYEVAPGQSVSDTFLVSNVGTVLQSFTITAADAFNDADGSFELPPTSDNPSDLGTWVTVDGAPGRMQFDLGPGQSRAVPFTLTVPANAKPGDHAGGLVASVVTTGDQVNVDRRVATRVYVRVPGDVQPALTISSVDAQFLGDWWNPFSGSVRIHYVVTNSGNIALAGNVSAVVTTWFGIPAAGQHGDGVPELLPGTSVARDVTIDGVGQWVYLNPSIKLDPFVDSSTQTLQVLAGSTTRGTVLLVMPWALLLLILLVVIVFLLRWWMRRRADRRAQEWIDYMEREAGRSGEPVGVQGGMDR